MAPPGAQPDLADAGRGPGTHLRKESDDSQATLTNDGAQPSPNHGGRASKRKASESDDDDAVVNNKRFRVTAEAPAGPTASNTTTAGLPTAAAPYNDSVITTAAPAVVDPPNDASTGPNEGPFGDEADEAAQPAHWHWYCCCCHGCCSCDDEPGNVAAEPEQAPSAAAESDDAAQAEACGCCCCRRCWCCTCTSSPSNGEPEDVPSGSEDVPDDEPVAPTPKKARRGTPLDLDVLCTKLQTLAWVMRLHRHCSRHRDGCRCEEDYGHDGDVKGDNNDDDDDDDESGDDDNDDDHDSGDVDDDYDTDDLDEDYFVGVTGAKKPAAIAAMTTSA